MEILKGQNTVKIECRCGKQSVLKQLCYNCYHKNYQRKKRNYVEGDREVKQKEKADIVFMKVLDEVKKGFTIERACKIQNISRSTLYRIISDIQKSELRAYKILWNEDTDD